MITSNKPMSKTQTMRFDSKAKTQKSLTTMSLSSPMEHGTETESQTFDIMTLEVSRVMIIPILCNHKTTHY